MEAGLALILIILLVSFQDSVDDDTRDVSGTHNLLLNDWNPYAVCGLDLPATESYWLHAIAFTLNFGFFGFWGSLLYPALSSFPLNSGKSEPIIWYAPPEIADGALAMWTAGGNYQKVSVQFNF